MLVISCFASHTACDTVGYEGDIVLIENKVILQQTKIYFVFSYLNHCKILYFPLIDDLFHVIKSQRDH